ncbi:MAG: 50S ribosomal protein L7/L12 [uncultured bacterium (gcode 4)]|uniref:50S ribosomal protein L7/L12 n=1 Tax=uncultured bacterium (gcode 4) TaxID=1234023 RepID=K2F574_9BACT|nr:MAG: 50S ribosomal protein L7/L12 [uncultured bacterium (gcode 4)]
MLDNKKLLAIKDFIISAEKSVSSAKKILATMIDSKDLKKDPDFLETNDLHSYDSWEDKIVEWVFTWESMLGSDWSIYPIPQNYASKSHLTQWSKLKAIIKPDWKIQYKIIEEIEHETKMWILTKNKDKYQVIAEWKTYNVLLAAVTYLKAEIGDNVAIRVPKWKDATFAAIESIMPK